MTKPPSSITYASVISRESNCINLMMADLNGLHVFISDVQNAYFQATVTKKTWTTCGPEFVADSAKQAIIVLALYGLKSAGYAFRNHIS